jgi:hypothetical protein
MHATPLGEQNFKLKKRDEVSVLRPYLDIFKAPGSPCHELTASDNSTSMRI